MNIQQIIIDPAKYGLCGNICVPGDKSLTHRAILLASLAQGVSYIGNWLSSADTNATLQAIQQLGINVQIQQKNNINMTTDCTTTRTIQDKSATTTPMIKDSTANLKINPTTNCTIQYTGSTVILPVVESIQKLPISDSILNNTTQWLAIQGGSLKGSSSPLYLHHAGTAMRLLAGILVGQQFPSILDGSKQLRHRPMKRVIDPLRQMGASIVGANDFAPLIIEPSSLHGITYHMPIPSAQVKSAILLASLFSEGTTVIYEDYTSRDHTERMLHAMGVQLLIESNKIEMQGQQILQPISLYIPGDFSSAAFFIVAGMILPQSNFVIRNVGLNVTRTGLWDVLLQMEGQCEIREAHNEGEEPVGNLHVQSSYLRGVTIPPSLVPRMIDEFPILMVVALSADGETLVTGAQELRVKESDRLATMTQELTKMGAEITELPDGFKINGPQRLHGAQVDSHDDHRVAMALTIAGLIADGTTEIMNSECVADSFPDYFYLLKQLGANIKLNS